MPCGVVLYRDWRWTCEGSAPRLRSAALLFRPRGDVPGCSEEAHDHDPPAAKPSEAGGQAAPDEDCAAPGGDSHSPDDASDSGEADDRAAGRAEAEREQEELEHQFEVWPAERHVEFDGAFFGRDEAAGGITMGKGV